MIQQINDVRVKEFTSCFEVTPRLILNYHTLNGNYTQVSLMGGQSKILFSLDCTSLENLDLQDKVTYIKDGELYWKNTTKNKSKKFGIKCDDYYLQSNDGYLFTLNSKESNNIIAWKIPDGEDFFDDEDDSEDEYLLYDSEDFADVHTTTVGTRKRVLIDGESDEDKPKAKKPHISESISSSQTSATNEGVKNQMLSVIDEYEKEKKRHIEEIERLKLENEKLLSTVNKLKSQNSDFEQLKGEKVALETKLSFIKNFIAKQ